MCVKVDHLCSPNPTRRQTETPETETYARNKLRSKHSALEINVALVSGQLTLKQTLQNHVNSATTPF